MTTSLYHVSIDHRMRFLSGMTEDGPIWSVSVHEALMNGFAWRSSAVAAGWRANLLSMTEYQNVTGFALVEVEGDHPLWVKTYWNGAEAAVVGAL